MLPQTGGPHIFKSDDPRSDQGRGDGSARQTKAEPRRRQVEKGPLAARLCLTSPRYSLYAPGAVSPLSGKSCRSLALASTASDPARAAGDPVPRLRQNRKNFPGIERAARRLGDRNMALPPLRHAAEGRVPRRVIRRELASAAHHDGDAATTIPARRAKTWADRVVWPHHGGPSAAGIRLQPRHEYGSEYGNDQMI